MTGLSCLRLSLIAEKTTAKRKRGKNMANPTYEVHVNDATSEAGVAQFNIDRTFPGRWTITFNNPPINMFVPSTIIELGALVNDIEADPSVKVVAFQSANPDFFIAHLDVAKAAARSEVLGVWRDLVLRLSSTPVVSIAKVRGRTRGIGNEFVLACDMRFASRQSALFGNPEVGVGLVPGGGALEWLPRLVGRSRALEIVLSGDDFDADIWLGEPHAGRCQPRLVCRYSRRASGLVRP
jgi:enoyl-CoA hydratase/carnithine racemase